MAEARILIFPDHLEIEAPYNKKFVETLKSELPVPDRKWDKQMVRWTVPRGQQAKVRAILDDFYEEVTEIWV